MKTKTLVGTSLLAAISVALSGLSVMVPLAGLPALRLSFVQIPIIIAGIIFGPLAGALSGIVSDLLGALLFPKGAYFPGFTLTAALWGFIPGIVFKFFKDENMKINYNVLNIVSIIALAIGVINILLSRGVLILKDGIFYLYESKLSVFYMIVYIVIVLAFVAIPILMSRKEKYSEYSLAKITFVVTILYLINSLGLNTLWLSMMYNKGFLIFLPGRIIAALVAIPLNSAIIYTLSKTFKHMEN